MERQINMQFRLWKEDRQIFTPTSQSFINTLERTIKGTLGLEKSDSLCELHKKICVDDINAERLKCFEAVNKIPEWKFKILKLTEPYVYYLIGQDLAIQRKLNVSIQMPGDKNSVLDFHQDYRSGDSVFQKVIWIPLTNSYSSNSMYMQDHNGSNYEPININKGEVLIFDPNTKHGNICNETSHSRVSINVRIKNWFTPDFGGNVPDRQFSEYYQDLCFSAATQRAFQMINELENN